MTTISNKFSTFHSCCAVSTIAKLCGRCVSNFTRMLHDKTDLQMSAAYRRCIARRLSQHPTHMMKCQRLPFQIDGADEIFPPEVFHSEKLVQYRIGPSKFNFIKELSTLFAIKYP
ncbi:hypothetical protein ACTFIR_007555 [Dictyostelium discoideum]